MEVGLPDCYPARRTVQEHDAGSAVQDGDRRYRGRSSAEGPTRTTTVYDIVNCGPRQSFTVLGEDGRATVVHNCYTFDPRLKGTKTIPFITYPFQDPIILQIRDAVGDHDLIICKSRGVGASWMAVLVFLWYFLFSAGSTFMLVSRKEDLVDSATNPDALFWKLDMALRFLPWWLRPTCERRHLMISNSAIGSTIDGESTVSEVGRGGRRTAILLDEFAAMPNQEKVLAATRDNSPCRIMNSTPQGMGNSFYMQWNKPGIEKVGIHWTQHPILSEGLYKDERGKPRSPWYDEQCERASCAAEIAQELDMDFVGSDHRFFDDETLDEAINRDARPPLMVGDLDYDAVTGTPHGFLENEKGLLALWEYVGADGPARDRRYAAGVDVCAGTGGDLSSQSVISLIDRISGAKIAEYANSAIKPDALAVLAVALCRYFCGADEDGAFLIWEANGPGRHFGDVVARSGDEGGLSYRHIYWRDEADNRSVVRKPTDVPGFFTTTSSKLTLMSEYRRCVASGRFANRSRKALEECRYYVFVPNGGATHRMAMFYDDPSKTGDNHGDRVVADALACRAIDQRESSKQKTKRAQVAPRNCLASRRLSVELAMSSQDYW